MAIPRDSKHGPLKTPNFHVTQKLLNCLFLNPVLHPTELTLFCTATEPHHTGNQDYFRRRMLLPTTQQGPSLPQTPQFWTNPIVFRD